MEARADTWGSVGESLEDASNPVSLYPHHHRHLRGHRRTGDRRRRKALRPKPISLGAKIPGVSAQSPVTTPLPPRPTRHVSGWLYPIICSQTHAAQACYTATAEFTPPFPTEPLASGAPCFYTSYLLSPRPLSTERNPRMPVSDTCSFPPSFKPGGFCLQAERPPSLCWTRAQGP